LQRGAKVPLFFFKEFQAIPLGNNNPKMEVLYEN
jgi:hypothetical protein